MIEDLKIELLKNSLIRFRLTVWHRIDITEFKRNNNNNKKKQVGWMREKLQKQ